MTVNCTQGLQFAPQVCNPDLPSANPTIFQNVLRKEQFNCGHGQGDHSSGGSPERRIRWLQQKINQLQRMVAQLEGSDGTGTSNGVGNNSPLGGPSSADPTSSQDPIQQLQQEISNLQQEISILQQQIGNLQQQLANLQGGMQGPEGMGLGGQGSGGLQGPYGSQGPYASQGQGAQPCGVGGYQNPVQQLQQQISSLQQEIAGLEQQLASLQQQLANLQGGQQGPYGSQGQGGLQGAQTCGDGGYQNQIQQLQQQLANLQQQLSSLQGPGSSQGPGCGCGPTSGLTVNGNTVNTGRYTITGSADGGGTLTIVDNSTGKNVKIWGDPHITTDKGDTANFQHQPVTFVLDDGTRVTIDPTNNPGSVEYINNVSITKGNDAVEMSGLHQGTLQTQYEPGMGGAARAQYAEGTEITPINGQLDQLQVVGGPMISGNSDPNLDGYASPTSSPAWRNTYMNGQVTLGMQQLFKWVSAPPQDSLWAPRPYG